MNPPAFVIALEGHEHSQAMAKDCLSSADNFGWSISISNAVNGLTITDADWDNNGIQKILNVPMDRPGFQGCFFSHWNLWNYCIEIDSPIVICEHDAVFLGEWHNSLLTNRLTKLHVKYKSKPNWLALHPEVGIWTPSAHAYIIYPADCKKIKKFVLENHALPPDVLIGTNIVEYEHLSSTLVDRNSGRISTTANLEKE